MSFKQRLYKFDVPVMLSASMLFGYFLFTDNSLVFWEGLIFVLLLALLTVYMIRRSRAFEGDPFTEEENGKNELATKKLVIYLFVGATCLYFGSRLLVDGASGLARVIGVSERVISLSVVAFGTSVPELAASIIAAFKKEKDLSLGNLIGSNIFNILAVLGVTSIIHPIKLIDDRILTVDIWWMFGVSFLLMPLMFLFRKGYIGRLEGVILLFTYISYITLLF